MVSVSNVLVTSKSGQPELLAGSEVTRDIDFKGTFVCKLCGAVYLDIRDPEDSDREIRRCVCGNTRFMAHQLCRHDVVVDGSNNFERDDGIYDSETPYGPYQCTQCNAEYDELNELPVTPVNATSSQFPVFDQYRITQEPQRSLYLSWEELSGLSSSLISGILGREVTAEAMREEYYDMYLFLEEPITSAEMDTLYEVVQATDDDRAESIYEAGEPVQKIEQCVSRMLIGKLLQFDLTLTRADDGGVWFIGENR
jgi:rubredoxin